MKKEFLKKKKLPDQPGVYLFKKSARILYVGKATSLRERVRSYMSKRLFDMRGPLVEKMAEEANNIDWQETDSVLEALILEANLIKKYQPKYNTKEKSDKSFNYVCITREKLPRVIIIRGKELERFSKKPKHALRHSHSILEGQVLSGRSKDSYEHILVSFGPFPSSSQLREALKIVRKIFPFLDEKSKNYLEFYRQINLVPDLDDRKLYMQNIRNIKLFFEGKKKQILKNLEKEMKMYAKVHAFEKAGEIKRQIFALKHINDVALLKLEPSAYSLAPSFRIEAYDIAHMGGKNMVGVMTIVEDGEVVKSEYKKFKIRTQADANDTGALTEVLERRMKHIEWRYPDLIVVDGGKAQINTAKKVLTKMNLDIPTVSVLKDERHKPKDILGDKKLGIKYEREILLANSEAHRFAINYHKNMRNKNFLK